MSRVRDLADFNSRVMDMDGNATDTITADTITADTITADTVTFTSSGTPTITSPTSIILNADSGNGIINFSGSKVMNLGDPVDSQDAAPKSYVDTEVSGVESYVNSIIYTDLDVDAHLNTASATSNQVLSWNGTSLTWTTQSSGALGLGNFTLAASVIDTDDSSGITITPAVTISSDLNVENDLRVTNKVYVDKDIKLLNSGSIYGNLQPSGSILTTDPAFYVQDLFSGQNMEPIFPERIYYDEVVHARGISSFPYVLLMGSPVPPVTIWSKSRTDVISVAVTIHLSTYALDMTSTRNLFSSAISNSQIIQGHIIHDETTPTFTITSNVCTTPGTDLATITVIMDAGEDLKLIVQHPNSYDMVRVAVHSKFALRYELTPYS
tara:strand:+ start:1711 stop:2853 length:1143 start_codon:yes stop_codon:yes gene_type:complete